MKLKIYFLFFIIFSLQSMAQIGMANHYPSLKPSHILDDDNLTEDIAFAYSLRLLRSDYQGPLIRLRRDSDDAVEDFYCGDNDKININAINSWRGTDNVFLVTIYDQSEEGRNASQNNILFQPQFIINITQSYWVGDGIDDILIVDGTFANLIEAGANGTILGLLYSTDDDDIFIGAEGPNVSSVRDGWYAHTNWTPGSTTTSRAYFDPGFCCGATANRSFVNTSFSWDLYTFIRRDNLANASIDRVIGRLNGITELNGTIDNSIVFTATNFPMGICAYVRSSDGLTSSRHSTTRATELIMFRTGKSNDFVTKIEQNQISFWNL